jgi:hypothetical protein
MRRLGLAMGVVGFVAVLGAAQAGNKGAVVDLGGYKSEAPANWKRGEPSNKFRAYQFEVPPVSGDKEPSEVVVFHFGGGGGGAKENIQRWKSQFAAPPGKSPEDIAQVSEFKVDGAPVTYLDISGIYLVKNPPFAPNAKVERKENFRMIAAFFDTPQEGPFFLRFVGPAKTVTEQKAAFDQWLKGFKK